jgi:hypothetical protein
LTLAASSKLGPYEILGQNGAEGVVVTPDGKHYAYSLNRLTDSDLFVVTGWK